jgi:hypothetical protein
VSWKPLVREEEGKKVQEEGSRRRFKKKVQEEEDTERHRKTPKETNGTKSGAAAAVVRVGSSWWCRNLPSVDRECDQKVLACGPGSGKFNLGGGGC